MPLRVTFADDPAHRITSVATPTGERIYEHGQGVYAVIDVANNGHLVMYSKASKTVPTRQFKLTFDYRNCIIGPCYDVPFSDTLTTPQFIAGVREPEGPRVAGGLLGMEVINNP